MNDQTRTTWQSLDPQQRLADIADAAWEAGQAAYGDSNDYEIESLRYALELALLELGIPVELTLFADEHDGEEEDLPDESVMEG